MSPSLTLTGICRLGEDIYNPAVYKVGGIKPIFPTARTIPASAPTSRSNGKSAVKTKTHVRTVEPVSKVITEELKEKLSPHARRMSDMFTFSFPSSDGVYIVPPCVDGMRREIRKNYVPSPNNQVYFIDGKILGCRFSMLQFLAAHAIHGEFDLTPLLRKIEYFIPSCETYLESNTVSFNGPDAAQVFMDVMSMFDYVLETIEEEEPSVTKPFIESKFDNLDKWAEFDFDSRVKDNDDFISKRKYLLQTADGDSIKLAKIRKWISHQTAYLTSGDAKLATYKESPQRGAPGYARVN